MYVADADGSHVHAVGKGLDPGWVPDGRHLVLVSTAFPATAACPSGHCIELAVLDLGTETLQQLTDNAPGVDEQLPSWSPDGTRIVYSDADDSAPHGTLEEPPTSG